MMAQLSTTIMNNLIAGATSTQDILEGCIVNGVQMEFDNGLDSSSDGSEDGIVKDKVVRMPMSEFKLS